MSSQALWGEFAEVIQHHKATPSHDAIDTVNRLLRKNPILKERGQVVQLPKEGLRVDDEIWTLDQLWGLIVPALETPVEPRFTHNPVAVLRWSGAQYLLDGRRRINHWKRSANLGPHRVLVLRDDI